MWKNHNTRKKGTSVKKRKKLLTNFVVGEYMVKINKPNKKKSLDTSWEGLYLLGGIYRPFIMKHDFMRATTM
jgi:hypothetical protein